MSTTTPASGLGVNFESIAQTECNRSSRPVSQDDRIVCLSKAVLFSGLSAIQYREVASVANEVFYSENETVFLQDEPVRRVLLVASGAVKISRIDEAGHETLLRLERAGEWLDDTSGSWQVHSVCARSTEESLLLAWDTAIFEAITKRIPTIERNMVRVMHTRLQALQDRFCDVSTLCVPQRLARTILRLGSDASHSISLSREEIAQMTGTTMFTVSRLLSSWAESDIVTLDRRRVFIESPDRLRELAEAA